TPLSTSLKVEFGALIVSSPSSIVTLGFTGALFIRVAGTGGMVCAGTGWASNAGAAFFFADDLFFFFSTVVFCGAGVSGPACCAQPPLQIIASTHAVAIARLIAGSALPASSCA